jgi:arylesterase / paraoxonase
MRPAIRSALTASVLVAVVAVGAAVRTLNAYGVFTPATPNTAGDCRALPTEPGPGAVAIDDKTGLVFVAVMDRRARDAGTPSSKDGLYVLQPGTVSRLERLSGTPRDFHPAGIALVRDANGLVLMAIDHRSDGTHSIEIFSIAYEKITVSLRSIGSIAGGALTSPSAIAAIDRDHFYVANDHGSTSAFGRALEDYLLLPRANIVYFDGMFFRPAIGGLSSPAGLALSPDGRTLYATETYGRRLDTFSRSPISGVLEQEGTLDIPSGLGGLGFDEHGNLWIASQPSAFALARFRADPKSPAPSQVFKVALVNGIPQTATPAFADDGGSIGGASAVAVSGTTMLVGASLDDHVLDCQIR